MNPSYSPEVHHIIDDEARRNASETANLGHLVGGVGDISRNIYMCFPLIDPETGNENIVHTYLALSEVSVR